MTNPEPDTILQRIDIWLWHARFFKSRSLATKVCRAGKVRINGVKITKAKSPVAIGDMLTFPQAKTIRIVRVLSHSVRRGPAPEAQTLYEDRTPTAETVAAEKRAQVAPREKGAGRPTKAERRATDRLRDIFPD